MMSYEGKTHGKTPFVFTPKPPLGALKKMIETAQRAVTLLSRRDIQGWNTNDNNNDNSNNGNRRGDNDAGSGISKLSSAGMMEEGLGGGGGGEKGNTSFDGQRYLRKRTMSMSASPVMSTSVFGGGSQITQVSGSGVVEQV